MRRALALAKRGLGRVEPNPMVGCVLVRRGDVVGEGWHRRYGGPHAEIEALRRAGPRARGSTAYVTLEPCRHTGKTPPCTDALLAAGVARVVAAVHDPEPTVSGGGAAIMRSRGIAVDVGCCGDEATALAAPFLKLKRAGRPWVILKWAQSLDGKIATREGDSRWISDEASRAHAHRTRGRVDAVVVGVGTVLADDPMLTCRVGRPRRVATRVVLDAQLRTPSRAALVRTARQAPTWVVCGSTAPSRRRAALERAGVMVVDLPQRDGCIALPALLDFFGAASMTNVLVEGGGRVLGAFADAGLADEVHVYVAPRLIGGAGAVGPLHARGAGAVAEALSFATPPTVTRTGDGLFVRGVIAS